MQIVNADQINKLAATNLSDMNGYIPGLEVDGTQPTQPNYSIRGIGTGDFGIGTDSPVGVYVDGIYTGKTGGALMNFNDAQRIEVLKGPQGTLFGRNSAAGAVSVVTKEPGNDFEADSTARLGQHGERYIDVLLNEPLSDTSALRFNFVDHKSDGWLNNALNGRSLNGSGEWGARATWRWDLGEQSKVLLSWEHESLLEPARPDISLLPYSLQSAPPFPVNPATYVNPLTAPVYSDANPDLEARVFDGVTLRYERPLGWATFNSTTGYRHFNAVNYESNSGTGVAATYLDTNNIENNTTWQQEFKLSGKNETVDWLTGVSLFADTGHQTSQVGATTDSINTTYINGSGGQLPLYSIISQQLAGAGFPLQLFGNSWLESMINKASGKSYAIYGDAIWHVTDRMNLTTGVRFSYDEKEMSWFNPPRYAPGLDAQLNMLPAAAGIVPMLIGGLNQAIPGGYTGSGFTQNLVYTNPSTTNAPWGTSDSWTNVSPRLVLDYKLTNDVMLYGSASKGYQAGGFNTQSVAGAYTPETMLNFEAGIKTYFRPQHLTINASLFDYKFSNLQSLNLVPATNGGIPLYQVTASDQTGKGLDLEARWQPTHDLRMFFTSEFINQKYGNYSTTATDYATNNTITVDLSGQPVGTPLWSAAGGIDYTQHGVFGGSVNYSLQHAYTGASRCNAASSFQGSCGSFGPIAVGTSTQRTDGRIGWDSGDHNWGLALYARNLFNERYVSGIDNTGTGTLGTPAANITAPRIVGVEVHASM